MSTKEQALDALADIEHQASGGLEIDPALFCSVRAALSAPAADGWVPVAERMPDSGCVVLACYRNSAGNLRRIRAEWVAAKTQESDDASDIGEYDEATDTYYDPQGWYERIDNWDDGFSAVGVSQGEVTHWMHLPDAPGAAAPRPAPAEPQGAEAPQEIKSLRDRIIEGELELDGTHPPTLMFLMAEHWKAVATEHYAKAKDYDRLKHELRLSRTAPAPRPAGGEPVAALIRHRSLQTEARIAHDGCDHYSDWSDWEPATVQHALAVTDPARNTHPLLWEARLLVDCQPQPAAQQEPLFWYRPRSDGLYEGPIHNAQIERVRKESGGWVPLYTQAGITATKGDSHE